LEKKEINTNKKNNNSFEFFLKQLLNGSLLTKQIITKHLPYLIFLAALAMFYINSTYKKDDLLINISNTRNEIKKLRHKSVVNAAELMIINRESEVKKLIKEKKIELKELKNPAIEIYYKK